MLKSFRLDPAAGLERQFLFWLSIGAPTFIGLLLAVPVWSQYGLDFSEQGYATFLRISRFPIAICSLAIPLSVLVGKLHGARQAALQIENTRKQIASAETQISNTLTQIANTEQDNKTKLYLAHFDHYCKHLDFVEDALFKRHHDLFANDMDPTPIISKVTLYKFMYPQNSLRNGVHPLDEDFIKFSQNLMARLLREYKLFKFSQSYEGFVKALITLENSLHFIQQKLFHCREFQRSIFVKVEVVDPNYFDTLHMGVNVVLDHYFQQMVFWGQLLDNIESFEVAAPSERNAYGFLAELGMPHSSRPSDMPNLDDYWGRFCVEHT